MKCENCNKELNKGERYCPNCGVLIPEDMRYDDAPSHQKSGEQVIPEFSDSVNTGNKVTFGDAIKNFWTKYVVGNIGMFSFSI